MLKKLSVILLSVTLIFVLFGCTVEESTATGSVETDTVYKVAMLYDSPIAGDVFSLNCLQGAEEAKSQYGIGLTICETSTSAEYITVLNNLAESGRYDLIVCISSVDFESIQQIISQYSDQDFVLVDSDVENISNLTSLLSRDEESAFLAGALAAMVTGTDTIGFIGGVDLPSIQRFLAGYRAGAQYVNPDCTVLVSYSGNWLNDGTTVSLVLQQSEQGADVFFGAAGAGNTGVIETAMELGLYAISADEDQSYLAPDNVIASTLKNVDVSVFNAISAAVSGNLSGGVQSVGLAEGGVSFVLNDDLAVITTKIAEEITELKEKIISGEIVVPGE